MRMPVRKSLTAARPAGAIAGALRRGRSRRARHYPGECQHEQPVLVGCGAAMPIRGAGEGVDQPRVDQAEPRGQCLRRVVVGRQGLGGVAELLDVIEVHRLQQIPASWKMPVQRRRPDSSPPGYLLERRIGAVAEEQILGGGNDQLTVASRSSAAPPWYSSAMSRLSCCPTSTT
jgi:hypothetical protein